jgi:predicted acyltransferase
MHLPANHRIDAIDQFRGFSIILMVLLNFTMSVESLPAWLKHSPDIGLTFLDLGAPVFIFAIGLTFGLSFRRRIARDGLSAAYGHFVQRYLSFIGIGAIISAGQNLLGLNPVDFDWGVLQAIGCAGLLTLTVIRLPAWVRLVIGLGLLAIYQHLLNALWLQVVLRSQHGGLPGTLSWAAILIVATVFGDLYHLEVRRKIFPLASVFCLAAGIALALVVPVSKNRVSASYDLITIGFSAVVFSIFYLTNFKLDFFSAWGRNPILLYLFSFLLTGLFVLPPFPVWHVQAPFWLVGLQALFILLILGTLARRWQKSGFTFSF